MTSRILGAGFNPTPPVATVPPFPPLEVVPVEVDEEIGLVYFEILYIVVLESWKLSVYI